MNQGKIWTVVKPTVGLPLIIGGAAVTALLVHYAILSHTTWFSSYWQGSKKVAAAELSTQSGPVAVNVTPSFEVSATKVN
jgi:light-harvesting protein B-800-850 alpha chain